jgi:hypothetical protein
VAISDAREAHLVGHIADAADSFNGTFGAAAQHRLALSYVDQEIAASCRPVVLSSVIRHRSAPTSRTLLSRCPEVDCVIRVYQSKTPATITLDPRFEKWRNLRARDS